MSPSPESPKNSDRWLQFSGGGAYERMRTTMKRYKARYVPVVFPAERCCAPGCGDKIKIGNRNNEMVEITDSDGQVLYLEENCIEWFENGHPDYGCPRGRLIWRNESEGE